MSTQPAAFMRADMEALVDPPRRYHELTGAMETLRQATSTGGRPNKLPSLTGIGTALNDAEAGEEVTVLLDNPQPTGGTDE
jgi:hypothetical protein